MEYIYTIDKIDDAAAWLLSQIGSHRIVALKGDMGVGKTTMTKAIVACMGGDADEVNSPTFSLVNEYETPQGTICHFDFYRIKNQREAVDFGIFDYFDSGRYCFMEWTELIPDLLPDDVLTVEITEISTDKRKLTVCV